MATNILDITQKIAEFQSIQIKKLLASIGRLGIVPLPKIDAQDYTPNFVIGSNDTQQCTCVNYLDLSKCGASQLADAVHEAIWEEYTGVFGISLERAFPFSFPKNRLLVGQEIQQRLNANIVFVLEPPKKTAKNPQGVLETMKPGKKKGEFVPVVASDPMYYLYETDDTFSRNRGNTLDLGPKKNISQVTEIKTTHAFTSQEIIAVLVPEILYERFSKELHEHFPGKVKKLPSVIKPINKLPEMLDIMHQEHIEAGMLNLSVPDYENTLKQLAQNRKRFALHAVRLHTEFDYTPRYIANLSNDSKLLAEANALVLKQNQDDSGWILIPQTKVCQCNHENVKLSNRFAEGARFREKLLAAKGTMQTVRFATEADKLEFLKKGVAGMQGVDAVSFNYDSLVPGLVSNSPIVLASYPPELKTKMDPIALEQSGRAAMIMERASELKRQTEQQEAAQKEAERRDKAARIIQKTTRKYFDRQCLQQYEMARKQHEEAQIALRNAEQALTKVTARLEQRKLKVAPRNGLEPLTQ
jgi:hypothetical protein